MHTRQVTIDLPEDVYHRIEVLAAKDDQRISDGITRLLTYLVSLWEDKHGQNEEM